METVINIQGRLTCNYISFTFIKRARELVRRRETEQVQMRSRYVTQPFALVVCSEHKENVIQVAAVEHDVSFFAHRNKEIPFCTFSKYSGKLDVDN